MQSNVLNIENTAIQDEQQCKTTDNIITEVVNVLLSQNYMNVRYGKEILRESMDALERVSLID